MARKPTKRAERQIDVERELEAAADTLFARFPAVVIGVCIPRPGGKVAHAIVVRGDEPNIYWLGCAVESRMPEPPSDCGDEDDEGDEA